MLRTGVGNVSAVPSRKCLDRKVRTFMGHLMADRPLDILAINFTLLEPSTSGMWNVLIMTDVFSKFTQAIPTIDQTAKTVAKVLVEWWFYLFGVPRQLHSHQGRCFESCLIQELCEIYGLAKTHTTPYRMRMHLRRMVSVSGSIEWCATCCTHSLLKKRDWLSCHRWFLYI